MPPKGFQQGNMQQINIGPAIASAENIKCECGCTTFLQGVELKKLSSIISPTGQDEIVPLPAFICSSCGKTLRLNDKEEKKEETKENSSLIM